MSSRTILVTVLCAVFILMIPAFVLTDTTDRIIDDDADLNEILDDIPFLDIKNATIEEFAELPAFTRQRAGYVVAFRDSVGSFIMPDGSVATIPGLSALQQAVLDHLVMTGTKYRNHKISSDVRSGIIYRPYEQELPDSRYYLRVSAETEHDITVTTIGDRDSFEPQAVDLISASASWHPGIDGNVIVIGDYRPTFGQRLLFSRYSRNYLDGTDIYLSKPSTVANTSFEESLFLRGGYLSVIRGPVTVDAFSSRRKLDSTLDENGGAVTIRTTGLHTDDEPRGNLTETVHALGVTVDGNNRWQLGVMGAVALYNPELVRTGDERSLYNPIGERFTYLSTAGNMMTGPLRVFFEHAIMKGGEHASTAGMQVGRERIRGSVSVRDYSKGYWALRSAGIHSFSGTENERGIYTALECSFPNQSSFAVSYDIARTLSRTYTSSMPGTRRHLNLQVVYPICSSIKGTVSFRSVDDIETGESRESLKTAIDRTFTHTSGFGWRVTSALTGSGSDTGFYGDGQISCMISNILRIVVVIAGFDIPGYDTRYYRFEPDVPGRGMSRPVWGRGGSAVIVTSFGPFSSRYRYVKSNLADTGHEIVMQMDIRH